MLVTLSLAANGFLLFTLIVAWLVFKADREDANYRQRRLEEQSWHLQLDLDLIRRQANPTPEDWDDQQLVQRLMSFTK